MYPNKPDEMIIALIDAILSLEVNGCKSPYPTVVIVVIDQYNELTYFSSIDTSCN